MPKLKVRGLSNVSELKIKGAEAATKRRTETSRVALQSALIPVTPFQQNCTIVFDQRSRRATVVDPGGDVGRIVGAIRELEVVVDGILLTHGHIDHAGGATALRESLGRDGRVVPIEGPDRRDRFLLDSLAQQGRAFGIHDARNVTPDRWLEEGAEVSIAGEAFEVYHCPGHTPGHVVFVSQALRFAIIGDVIFRGAVGRTDFPYGDGAALITSIRSKLLPLGDDIYFTCGHGPGSSFGVERRSNPFLR